MHAFTPAEFYAELAAEAAAWRLTREAAPATPALSALRNRLGEALVAVGIRLMQPAHLHTRIRQHAA